MEKVRAAQLNYYGSRGDNCRITRLKLNQHELNKQASLTKYAANINVLQTKLWFVRLL